MTDFSDFMDYITASGYLMDEREIARDGWMGLKKLWLFTPEEGDPFIQMVSVITGEPISWPPAEIEYDTALRDWYLLPVLPVEWLPVEPPPI